LWRNDVFLNEVKKAKYFPLAPIAVKILISLVFWDEAYKIVTESGRILPKMPYVSASKLINELKFKLIY